MNDISQAAKEAPFPKELWLQWYGDGAPEDGEPERENITWCEDNIYAHDVHYIRADVVKIETDKATAALTPKVSITAELLKRMVEADAKGEAEYGATVDRRDFAAEQWIDEAVNENLDSSKYLLALKDGIVALREENERLKNSLREFLAKAKVYGMCGETNHPAVKCKVEGLTLGDFYALQEALNPK